MTAARYDMECPPAQVGDISALIQRVPLHHQLLASRGITAPSPAQQSAAAVEIAAMLAHVRGQIEFAAFHNNPIELHELQWLARMYEYSGLIDGKKMAEPMNDPASEHSEHQR